MLLLRANNDDLQIVTDASADIEVHLSAMVADSAAPPALKGIPDLGPLASIVTATTTTVIDSSTISGIASGDSVNVEHCNIRNNHASTSCNVTVRVIDGTNTVDLAKVNLLAGEWLVLTQSGLWVHYDSNGGAYPSVGNAASQTEMEAGTATDRFVTPLGVNWHPGVCKSWAKHSVSAGVPQMTASWNVTSVTDSAVCRVAPVIATDFSSANFAINYGFECNTTTYSATTTALIQCIRNGSQAAGGFTMDLVEIDIGQTTDPAAWHWTAFGDQ